MYIGPSFLPRASLAEAKPTRAALAAAPVQGSKPQKLHTSQPCTPAHLPPREICPRNRSERTWDRLEAVQQLPAFDCRAPLPRFFFCCACIINRLCLTKSGHSCEVCAPQLVNMPLPTSLDTFLRSMDMLRSSIYVAKAPEPRLPPGKVSSSECPWLVHQTWDNRWSIVARYARLAFVMSGGRESPGSGGVLAKLVPAGG